MRKGDSYFDDGDLLRCKLTFGSSQPQASVHPADAAIVYFFYF